MLGLKQRLRLFPLVGAVSLGVILPAVMAGEAAAQGQPTPPTHYSLDERGVDMVTGGFIYSATEVVIGDPDNGGIVHGRIYANNGWRDTLSGTIQVIGSTYIVSLGPISEVFTLSGSTYTPQSNTGATLTRSGTTLTFTTSDGTVATYSTVWSGSVSPYQANNAALMNVRRPNGDTLTFNWDGITYCTLRDLDDNCMVYGNATRIESVTSNRGYQINYTYQTSDIPEYFPQEWLTRTGAIGLNLAVDYCSPWADECTGLTQDWPSVQYTDQGVVDQSGRTTVYTHSAGGLSGIRLPGSTTDDITITYASGRVASVSNGVGTWNYAWADSGSTRTLTTTNPDATSTVAVSNQSIGRVTSFTNELSETVSYQYDGQRRLTRSTHPEGNYTQITYDARGNVTQTRHVAKPGSGLADIVESATYLSSCTNPRICNLPTSTTDARGNVTDYTYDANHGGVLTITLPAPASGGTRPQTRFTYEARHAWYKNASGNIVQAPTSVTLPVAVSECITGSSCANTANEVRTTIAYGSTGVANNLRPTAVSSGAGNGSLTATTSFTWTPQGDVASVDGPLAGAGDTTRFRYDAARQRIGVIGPDPASPGLRRASRVTYNPIGQPTLIEVGTVNGLTDTDWNNFASLQRREIVYDAQHLPVIERLWSGTTAWAMTQQSYDARGRVTCSVVRMNPATFASPPASACTPATVGTFGPDRITQTSYNGASRVTSVVSGFASGDPITESLTWTANGQVETITDGRGRVSTLVYDGFDRLSRTRYPEVSGSGSSATDYEELTYDAASNVVSERRRSGAVFTASYDNLNRVTTLTTPSGMENLAYTYDNLGRRLTQSFAGGQTLSFTWDALSRNLSQSSPLGTVGFQYDLAGRRTRITWPDNVYAQYDYNLYGEVTAIRENGASSGAGVLGAYTYDNLGRLTGVSRGNGVGSTMAWDGASRMTTLSHDAAGSAHDLSIDMAHSPASQITSRTLGNDAFAYGDRANGTTGYTLDGLNRIAAVNATSLSYDANSNLASDGVRSFTYNAANQLLGAGPLSLTYDPAGRLYEAAGAATTRYLYAGNQVIGEYSGAGALLRRHVPGVGMDAHIAFYEGTGTTGRRWPLSDERGSIIAITLPDGTAASINTYDEYGQPGSLNTGTFGYTGQMWLAEAGLWHYRARAYHPTLGRFLQPDPIGYGDGLNLYAYVRNDPVNMVDPSGLSRLRPGDSVTREQCRAGGGTVRENDSGTAFCVLENGSIPISFSGSGQLPSGGTRIAHRLVSQNRSLCASIQARLSEDMGALPGYVFMPHYWNDPESLRFFESRFRTNREVYDYLEDATMVMSIIVMGIAGHHTWPEGRAPRGSPRLGAQALWWLGAAGFAANNRLGEGSSDNAARARAIRARIEQIAAECA